MSNSVSGVHGVRVALLCSACLVALAVPAVAQDQQQASNVENVTVTGLISSLQKNLDIKRDASGLVDAISAEDIGKFPDVDIAAAMQRIPGVTISRGASVLGGVSTSTGAATEITVRGFGPSFNETLFDGRKIRVLTIVDNFTRISPAIDVRLSYRGADVVATLERIARSHGRPKCIRVDNGPEFISKELDLWAWMHGVALDFSRPGKPTDNAFAESFNGKFRTECLNAHWFMSLDDARRKCEAWRRDYNEERPHSAIGNKAPISLLNGSSAPPPA